ncbi:MAG TPA: UDP-N-acetylmuramoyl-L-alanyl-D-glutamate--2,6-diaminopimelate ligase [Candidatus Omnitrophota bacterium]|nr:UDP-N-acetylmuramoyl-L-alanyl-D-glutamate--2,6-diaminopimelate ligase [Candidatus Omnitrophota bacterium]
MHLERLLEGIYQKEIPLASRQWEISAICNDSRKIEKDALFIAQKGSKYDGADFIPKAIEKGIRVIAVSENKNGYGSDKDVLFLEVGDTSQFLKELSRRFYGEPSKALHTVGVTGTNGKTTTVYLIESILHEAERSCGVIGTVNYRIGEKILPAQNTTPGLLDNQKLFSELLQEGIDYCLMEVSSHALDQGRVDLIDFKTAVFTNLTSDHLDYHKTRENYFAAKSLLFTKLSPDATAVINVDDTYGKKLLSKTESKILTYGIRHQAQVMAEDVQLNVEGTQFKVKTPAGQFQICSPLVGYYNVYNILAAVAVAVSQGINLDKIKRGVEHLKNVPGRLERVECGQDFTIFIDYAHTQDALENVLTALRATSDARIILVFGCGGDRDNTKRPVMGAVASHLADVAIVTSDNPRSEDPQTIINQIVAGFEKDNYTVVLNREEAIKKALSMAQKGDIVLIAGKGHETYQIFKDKTIQFDERQIIRQSILQ